jgi:hypothetical protein
MGKKLRGGILPFGDNISFLMKGLWFTAAQKMTMQPAVAEALVERIGHRVPWILMGVIKMELGDSFCDPAAIAGRSSFKFSSFTSLK